MTTASAGPAAKTRVISGLSEIASGYDALICDLWGVYHNGVQPFDAAVAALREFRAERGPVILLTNAPRPSFSVARQLAAMGAPTDTHNGIVTSGDATIAALRAEDFGDACYHLGPERDLDLFAELDIARVPLDEAQFILCSGLFDDTREGPEDYADTIAAGIARDLTLLCANPDVVVDRGERRIYCAGAIAEGYAQAGGTVRTFGKPHAPVYDLSAAAIAEVAGRDIPRSRILAVGDGPATDIKGAADHGFDALFVAGGLAAETLLDAAGTIRENALHAYCETHAIAPRYAIPMLC